jgi:hypothetical protein
MVHSHVFKRKSKWAPLFLLLCGAMHSSLALLVTLHNWWCSYNKLLSVAVQEKAERKVAALNAQVQTLEHQVSQAANPAQPATAAQVCPSDHTEIYVYLTICKARSPWSWPTASPRTGTVYILYSVCKLPVVGRRNWRPDRCARGRLRV